LLADEFINEDAPLLVCGLNHDHQGLTGLVVCGLMSKYS
jgi:hypothetical protein